jgi:hypothetical protein
MAVPQLNLHLETDDPTEVERLDEARRLLGADLLQIDDVTEVRLLAAEEVPDGVRSGVVWQDAALTLVLGGLGYRAITKRTANELARVLIEFIKRHKGKGVRLEYKHDGKSVKIDAEELSEQTVERLSTMFTEAPAGTEPTGDDAS